MTISTSKNWHLEPEAIAAIVCGVLLLCGWFSFEQKWLWVGLISCAIAYIVGGFESAKEGLTTLFIERELDVDLLMIVAALGAASLGWWEKDHHLLIDGGVLIFIFAVSGALESYAMAKTEKSIHSLMSLTPDIARIIIGDKEENRAIDQLAIGDVLLVKPGELIPTDGVIINGSSNINQAAITGESLPVDKTVGDRVFGGTINGNGVLTLQIDQPPASSLIQRIIKLVQQAQTETPPSQEFIENFERNYAKVIVVAGLLLGILPPFILGWDWETTIYRALIFLVVSSPCAMMAAIMPTLLSGMSQGARKGILFKGGSALESIGLVKAVAFDKTGTLTTGKLNVVEVISNQSREDVLQLAAAIEFGSEHPIGQAIINTAIESKITWERAEDITAYPGLGIQGKYQGKIVGVGKINLFPDVKSEQITDLQPQVTQWEKSGHTAVWVMVDRQVCGVIILGDRIREEAKFIVQQLKSQNIHQIILTGDNQASAEYIANQLGITEVYAELLPEDKVKIIQELQEKYQRVAMVGDGINDAPALAMASVGIAMGVTGSDIALETADIILMTDSLSKLGHGILLGRKTQGVIKQNIIFALSFIVLLLIGNFTGHVNLPLGVFGHEGSTVLVTLNGLRLLR
jgi:Cd2+/Zn2+-exporting ATPase